MASYLPTTRQKATTTDIDALRSLLDGTNATVLAPSDPGYAKSLKRWSSAAEKPAGVVILPTSAEEVSIALKYATQHNLDVAIKGGGHSSAGTSSTDGGVLFDLGKMGSVTVDPERRLLHVQGGAIWGDVDAAAYEHGLATVGGTVADTGVGGLTLGGGYGWLTFKYGLVIDNLVQATVVLANGDIKTASETQEKDLFWALRGAGQNFGVVTEFVLKAYPQGEVYVGLLIYAPTPDNIEKVVAVANDLFTHVETPEGKKSKCSGRVSGGILLARLPPELQPAFVFFGLFDGPEEEGKKFFQPFADIGPIANTMHMAPYPEANKLQAIPYGMRASMKGTAFNLPIRPQFVLELFEHFVSFTEANPDAAGTMAMWELQEPSVLAVKDTGSYANRGYHFNALLCPMWTHSENDQPCRQWARDGAAMFQKELEVTMAPNVGKVEQDGTVRNNQGSIMLYGNYDQYEERSKDVFGNNYEPLKKLKKVYDPTSVFNKLFTISVS